MKAYDLINKAKKVFYQDSIDSTSTAIDIEDIETLMIDFAKFHVYEAVKAQIRLENDRISDESEIDELTKEALNHIYPLKNIK